MIRRIIFAVTLTFAALTAACGPTGAPETQTLDVAYPVAEVVNVTLATNDGTVQVTAADTDGVTGTTTTNVADWQSTVESAGDSITIRQGQANVSVIQDGENAWDVQLGRGTPIQLTLNNTAADTTLNLGGLSLAGLMINATSADYIVNYPAPNPLEDGGEAAITLVGGTFTGTNLLNPHWRALEFTTNNGDATLRFNGAMLMQDLVADLTSISGNLLVDIAPGVPAQITFRTTGGRVREIDPAYAQTDEITYTIGGFETTDDPRLIIAVRTTTGDLRLASTR
ncbi:MAG: hypothetical protein GYB67_19420 [Chloroflexi bacterium]|nr:hypothetical protein [Chloroflexota bacterium]